jgi:hypothetical protein
MNELILYCKSYNKDVNRVKILLNSIDEYNEHRIPFYISVPTEDVQLFKDVLGNPIGKRETLGNYQRYTLITDEEVCGEKYDQSWVTQQTIKSSFWKLDLCHNYVMVDSDSYFIQPFFLKDFIIDEENHVPYTIIHEQKDLFSWTAKNVDILGFDPQRSFAECRQPIQELFERKGRLYDFGPGPIIWSTAVWKSLEDKYLIPNNIKFSDLINSVHSEFTWYGEWLLTDKTIPIWPVEPLFKFFHYMQEYQDFKNRGYTIQNWAKNYMGVVMQSSSGLPLTY